MNAFLFPLAFVSPALFLSALLGLKESREHPVLKSLALGLCAAVAFYGMRCDSSTDIYRHIALLPAYNTSFLGCFDAGHYGGLYVWDIWCWIIEKTGDPYLLQCSAAFVGYSIIAYICIDYSCRYERGQAGWVAPFLFAVCAVPVFPLVAGIRSTMAVLICALSFYLHSQKEMPLVIAALLDVCAIMIHQVAIFPLIFLLVLPLARKGATKAIVTCFVTFLFIAAIGQLILPYLPSDNGVLSFLRKALESLLRYDAGNSWTEANRNSLNGIANRISTISLILVVVTLSMKYLKKDEGNKALFGLGLYTCLISVASMALIIVLPVNGERFLPTAFALGAPFISDLSSANKKHGDRAPFVAASVVAILSLAALALHVYSLVYGLEDPSGLVLTCLFGAIGATFGL
ncbi:MAG: EpsG family protein [Phoenicibacter congonensis]|uniref:EpsG family protein n=1 Tax=Phoenicibacter congonensis TaxID=1944646 RepID=A0AA43RKF8_9ACTN|nr:EpsG family protein [Phoenicibacter congonensis]